MHSDQAHQTILKTLFLYLFLAAIFGYRYRFESLKNHDKCDLGKSEEIGGILFTHSTVTKYGQEVLLKDCKIGLKSNQAIYLGQYLTARKSNQFTSEGKFSHLSVQVDQSKSIHLLVKLSILREQYKQDIYRLLKGDRALIFLGIFLGSRDIKRNTELYGQITQLGLSHLFVASGFNVSYIVNIFGFLKQLLPRWLYISIMSGLLLIYNVIVGFEIPILRSTLLSLTIFLFKNSTNSIHWLIMIGFGFCIFNPFIITSLSFQLSFVATYAVLISNGLRNGNEIAKKKKSFLFVDELKTSAFVVIFIFPILSINFGVLNPFSIFINPVISPFISLIMILGMFTIVGQYVLFNNVLYFVSDLLHFIIRLLFGVLGIFNIPVQMSLVEILAYYFLLFSVIHIYRRNETN